MSIVTEVRDPRVRDVTVLGVEVTADMREAKVSVSVMGDEAQQALSLRGLQNSAGFLQSKIAAKIEARYVPKLRFVLDQGIKNVAAVGEILARIRQEQEAARGAAADAEPHEEPAEPQSAEPESAQPGTAAEPGAAADPQAAGDDAAEPGTPPAP